MLTQIDEKGKPLGIPYGKVIRDDIQARPVNVNDDSVHHVCETDSKNARSPSSTSGGGSFEWPGDRIPKKDLERLQKKFKLTNEQMNLAMERSRLEFRGQPINDPRDFHNYLNRIVYVIIIAVLIYVVNRDYNDIISFWFALYFPMEANTLGMFVPEPKDKTS